MSKHIRDYGCSWCSARFDTLQGVRAHERTKHKGNMPVSDDDWQRIELEREHRRRMGLSTGKLSPKYKFG
jgi:hypothetical protein